MSSQRYERVCRLRPVVLRPSSFHSKAEIDADGIYYQISEDDRDDATVTPTIPHDTQHNSPSPPPSFRSYASSPSSRRLLDSEDPIATDAERTLNDTFDDGSDSEGEDAGDDRQRLMRHNTTQADTEQRENGERPALPRTVTTLPLSSTPAALGAALAMPTRRPAPFNQSQNDGVFANLDAKPERGEKLEELPPVRQPVFARFAVLMLTYI